MHVIFNFFELKMRMLKLQINRVYFVIFLSYFGHIIVNQTDFCQTQFI